MTDASDRFKLASDSVVELTKIAGQMIDIGVYDRDEHAAMEVLVSTLSRAMKVLDPEEYRNYLNGLVEQGKAFFNESEVDEEAKRIGQYL